MFKEQHQGVLNINFKNCRIFLLTRGEIEILQVKAYGL
jgi:hypothetical protein